MTLSSIKLPPACFFLPRSLARVAAPRERARRPNCAGDRGSDRLPAQLNSSLKEYPLTLAAWSIHIDDPDICRDPPFRPLKGYLRLREKSRVSQPGCS